MTTGWMKLHRSLLEKPMFEDAYTLQVLIYCLLRATYKDMCVKVGNQAIALKPGQLLYGRKSVSQKLGMGEGKLRGIMQFLEQNGTIAIESCSRYSIVTIINWEKYQYGDGTPEFPFDCDFLEEENDAVSEDSAGDRELKKEPSYDHSLIQSDTGIAGLGEEISASEEPQYNNIKNNKNKIKNNKTKENKTREKKNMIRQSGDAVYECIMQDEVRVPLSQSEYFSGGGAIKGEMISSDRAKGSDAGDLSGAAVSFALDDNQLETYFAQCDFAMFDTDAEICCNGKLESGFIPLDDSDMPGDCSLNPGHDFLSEMVYELSPQDIERLERMFTVSAG